MLCNCIHILVQLHNYECRTSLHVGSKLLRLMRPSFFCRYACVFCSIISYVSIGLAAVKEHGLRLPSGQEQQLKNGVLEKLFIASANGDVAEMAKHVRTHNFPLSFSLLSLLSLRV